MLDGIGALLVSVLVAAASTSFEGRDGLSLVVVGSLVATSLLCAAFLVKGPRMGAAMAVVAVVLCAAVPGAAPFLPVAAYLCMVQPWWAVRVLWAAAWLWLVCCGVDAVTACELAAACLVVSALAVRTVRTETLLRGLQSARDDMSERLVMLRQERAAGASAVVSEAEGLGGCSVAGSVPGAVAPVSEAAVPENESSELPPECLRLLTQRELSIARLIAEGCTNRQIAAQLFLSEGTVRNHVSSILQKTHAENRTQVAMLFRP